MKEVFFPPTDTIECVTRDAQKGDACIGPLYVCCIYFSEKAEQREPGLLWKKGVAISGRLCDGPQPCFYLTIPEATALAAAIQRIVDDVTEPSR